MSVQIDLNHRLKLYRPEALDREQLLLRIQGERSPYVATRPSPRKTGI